MKTRVVSAPPLRVVQQRLAASILSGPASARTPEGGGIEALIVAPPRGDPSARLQVYAGGYPARVEDVVRETFPAVTHVLGAAALRALVKRYITAVPLRSYNLNDAGAALPGFLQSDRLSAELPFLPDLVQLEWEVVRAFHASDEVPFDPALRAAWTLEDWERAVVHLQPWVALVHSAWPIRDIWEQRETPIEAFDVTMHGRPDRVLVRRCGYTVVCESLEPDEADALDGLRSGTSLGAVLNAATARGSDPTRVGAWFARWTERRLIADCRSE